MLYLASQSPRRRELLGQIGESHRTLDVDVEEIRQPGESPDAYVSRVALDKARAGFARVAGEPGARVLGADTEVVLGDEVFGKPGDADDAAAMLRRLSGVEHRVVSVVWLVEAAGDAYGLAYAGNLANRVTLKAKARLDSAASVTCSGVGAVPLFFLRRRRRRERLEVCFGGGRFSESANATSWIVPRCSRAASL